MIEHEEQKMLEDILNDYVTSNPEPNKQVLAEWIRRYPQYQRELIEFTVSWSLMKWSPPSPHTEKVDEDTLVLRGMSVVQNLLYQEKKLEANSDEAPIKSLLDEGSKLGLTIQNLAELSELSISLWRKLDRRLIRPQSIPGEVIQNIARVIQRSISAVTHYLQGERKRIRDAYYRANRSPSLGEQEDFFEAVRNDTNITEERRQRWLALESPKEE